MPCFTDAALLGCVMMKPRIILLEKPPARLPVHHTANYKSQVNNASRDFRLTLVAQCVYFAVSLVAASLMVPLPFGCVMFSYLAENRMIITVGSW